MDKMVGTLKESVPLAADMHRPNARTVWGTRVEGPSRLRVGEWVEVTYEYAPGVCSDGGVGCIKRVHEAADPAGTEPSLDDAMTVDVKYLLDGRTEKCIHLNRITVIPMPYVSRSVGPPFVQGMTPPPFPTARLCPLVRGLKNLLCSGCRKG